MRSRDVLRKGRLVATVLSGAWRNSSFPPLNVSEAELDEVTPLLYGSGAAALGWRRLANTDLRNTSSAEVLHQAYRLQSLQAEILEQKIEKVFRLLRQSRVDSVLAKGWVAAGLYTDHSLRPYGDIDICIRPGQFKLAQEILTGPGAWDCWVDLHEQFSEINERSFDELFARSRLINLGEEQIRILGHEDHLALLCIHLLKHGAWRPLWLCDIGAAIESLPPAFDWEVFFGHRKRNAEWILSAIGLSQRLLGATVDQLPVEARPKEIPDWLVQNVLSHWSNLFPGDRLPMRPPLLMAKNLKRGRNIIRGTVDRWPDPITATFNLNGQFNNFPRLPYQLAAFVLMASRYLIHLPRKLQS
jgi:hypothetical protein